MDEEQIKELLKGLEMFMKESHDVERQEKVKIECYQEGYRNGMGLAYNMIRNRLQIKEEEK